MHQKGGNIQSEKKERAIKYVLLKQSVYYPNNIENIGPLVAKELN